MDAGAGYCAALVPAALISDALASGEGDVAEGLRPLYISYLKKHEETTSSDPRGGGDSARFHDPGHFCAYASKKLPGS